MFTYVFMKFVIWTVYTHLIKGTNIFLKNQFSLNMENYQIRQNCNLQEKMCFKIAYDSL